MKLSHVVALMTVVVICLPCAGAEQGASSGQHAADAGASADSHSAQGANGASHRPSNVLFSTPLQDVPGKELVAVALEIQPRGKHPSVAHRHPGSVFVYITRGTARFGIEGQPVQEVHTGETFFEPPGALHTVAESASATESAAAIAVLIVPTGAPLTTVEPHP